MNKNTIWLALVLVVAIGASYLYSVNKEEADPRQDLSSAPQAFDGRNSTFRIEERPVTLADGLAEEPLAQGSASKLITRYFGNEATGDLNGDGLPDTAFLVTQSAGGSGTFYYVVVALQTADGYRTTSGYFIGDRIAPQSTYIPASGGELQVNYAERQSGDPMTASPSVGATKVIRVSSEGMLVGEDK